MATINDGELLLDVPSCSDRAALRQGFAAGEQVLRDSGIPLWCMFVAVFNREGLDFVSGEVLSDADERAAAALDAGDAAAAEAMGIATGLARFGLAEAVLRSEREIDEQGIRHLNPWRGPHYELESVLPREAGSLNIKP